MISDALPFGRLWYREPNAVSNAIGYAQHRSRSHDAVIRVYDDAGSVIEKHEHGGRAAPSQGGPIVNGADSSLARWKPSLATTTSRTLPSCGSMPKSRSTPGVSVAATVWTEPASFRNATRKASGGWSG